MSLAGFQSDAYSQGVGLVVATDIVYNDPKSWGQEGPCELETDRGAAGLL